MTIKRTLTTLSAAGMLTAAIAAHAQYAAVPDPNLSPSTSAAEAELPGTPSNAPELAAEALERKLHGAGSAAKDRPARLTALARELSNLVDAIATCGVSPALQAKLAAVEAEIAEIKKAPAPTSNTHTIDDVMARYKRLAADLPAAT